MKESDDMADEGTFPDVHFLTVSEVAEVMRVSRMTVYRMIHAGELPAVQFGRSYRVPESAVEQYLRGIIDGKHETA
jgi:excisionase family DNA binding protein